MADEKRKVGRPIIGESPKRRFFQIRTDEGFDALLATLAEERQTTRTKTVEEAVRLLAEQHQAVKNEPISTETTR